MSILNYFFIGVVFIFLIELLRDNVKNHPQLKNANWGWGERILCILIWPIALIRFSISFIKTYFK